MVINVKHSKNKVRVNLTLDKKLLNKAKTKMEMFGGKLSTLMNAYLKDFVSSMDKDYNQNSKAMNEKVKELEDRLKKVEKGKK
jgi:hypothetical protein